MLDYLDKLSSFILQATGSLSSWQTVSINLFSCLVVFYFREHLYHFYVTLHRMDNPIVTFATWGLIVYSYIALHKIIAAVFNYGKRYKNSRSALHEASLHKEAFKLTLLQLSRN